MQRNQQLKLIKNNIYRNKHLEPIKNNIYENQKYVSNDDKPVIINNNIYEYKKYEYNPIVNKPILTNYETNKRNYEYYKNRNQNSNAHLHNLFSNKSRMCNLKPIKKKLIYKKSDEEINLEYIYPNQNNNNFVEYNIKNAKKFGRQNYLKNIENNIQKLPKINYRPPFKF